MAHNYPFAGNSQSVGGAPRRDGDRYAAHGEGARAGERRVDRQTAARSQRHRTDGRLPPRAAENRHAPNRPSRVASSTTGFTSTGSIGSEISLTSRKLRPGTGAHAADRTALRVDDVLKLDDSDPEPMAANRFATSIRCSSDQRSSARGVCMASEAGRFTAGGRRPRVGSRRPATRRRTPRH